jgi:hypothetical protein
MFVRCSPDLLWKTLIRRAGATKTSTRRAQHCGARPWWKPARRERGEQSKIGVVGQFESHNKEVHDLAMKLEKGLNDLGRRLGQEITNLKDGDISQLKHIASIAKGLCALALAAIAGGVLVKLLWHQ